jgi:hypothetical protein
MSDRRDSFGEHGLRGMGEELFRYVAPEALARLQHIVIRLIDMD